MPLGLGADRPFAAVCRRGPICFRRDGSSVGNRKGGLEVRGPAGKGTAVHRLPGGGGLPVRTSRQAVPRCRRRRPPRGHDRVDAAGPKKFRVAVSTCSHGWVISFR
jgi:hypothetical protein